MLFTPTAPTTVGRDGNTSEGLDPTTVARLMGELAARGMAILMISSELPEVLGMADRVLVMREGRLTGEFPRAQATPEAVMYAATADVPKTFATDMMITRDMLTALARSMGFRKEPVAELNRLGIPTGTAKSRLHYALAAMRLTVTADADVETVPLTAGGPVA